MRTLTPSMTLIELLQERAYTAAQLKAHPLTAQLAREYEELHIAWLRILDEEIQLAEAVVTAQALARSVDADLDRLFDAIVAEARARTEADPESSLMRRLLGTQRPQDARRPVLGEQLELMRRWPEVLFSTDAAPLHRLAAALSAALQQGEKAGGDRTRAEQALTDFEQRGERFEFIERFNGLRRATREKVVEIQQRHPELPVDFAARFFQQPERPPRPTPTVLEQQIKKLEAQLTQKRTMLSELRARRDESERTRRAAEQRALRTELGQLEEEQRVRATRIAAIQKKLEE